MKKVFVFRTSIALPAQVDVVAPLLKNIFSTQERWHFDLEDRENILKAEVRHLTAETIIETVNAAGFFCEELED